eukprot:scaffold109995_cov60-Phaeocystis_antarctica.AAC.2
MSGWIGHVGVGRCTVEPGLRIWSMRAARCSPPVPEMLWAATTRPCSSAGVMASPSSSRSERSQNLDMPSGGRYSLNVRPARCSSSSLASADLTHSRTSGFPSAVR